MPPLVADPSHSLSDPIAMGSSTLVACEAVASPLSSAIPLASSIIGAAATLESASASSSAFCGCPCDCPQDASGLNICPHLVVNNLQAGSEYLFIDLRPFCQYSAGHIRGAMSITCSVILLKRLEKRLISVVDLISDAQRTRYRAIHSTAIAVVYDESSSSLQDSHVHNVFAAIQQDTQAAYFLRGGYSAIKAQFPNMVECDTTTLPRQLIIQRPLCAMPSGRSPCQSSATLAMALTQKGPTKILPFLFLGSRQDAEDRDMLRALNIRYILNVTPDCPNFHVDDDFFVYKQIPVLDSWHQEISQHFDEAIDFIDDARTHNCGVLVHCMAGISRSATIVIAYLMKRQNKTLDDALAFVKSRRSHISPNLDFMGHLLMYERKLDDQHMLPAAYLCPQAGPMPISTPN